MILDYQKPAPAENRWADFRAAMIVVLAVAGLLAVLSVQTIRGSVRDAQIKAAKLDVHNLAEAIADFQRDNGRYPTNGEGIAALVQVPAGANMPGWRKILDSVPLDPWGHPYIYTAPAGPGQSFKILSYGPDGKPGGGDDISN